MTAAENSGGKTAVVLLNLGGPSREEDIRPFLFNFFRDENVITAPNPVRFLIAFWIAVTRSKGAAKTSYAHLGGKSPLLENTQKQARALEDLLRQEKAETRVFVAMRHWHPYAADVARDVAAFRPDKIVLLPLYPQYSTTTTLSALQDWARAAHKAGLENIETQTVCCYPEDAGFVSASAALIRDTLAKTMSKKTRLLFSAHGLPEKIIAAGDPYQKQIERTAAAIVEALSAQTPDIGTPDAVQQDSAPRDWQICYQSRVGRLKWIGPSIDEALQKAAADNAGVVIYPLAFVSEHVETLVELDIEYKHRAAELGIPAYARVPTVGTHPHFIAGLKDLVSAPPPMKGCAGRAGRCYCKEKNK